MTEDVLEGVNIATVAEIVNGEDVAESVKGEFLNPGTFADGRGSLPEHVAIEGVSFVNNEEVIIGSRSATFRGNVFPL